MALVDVETGDIASRDSKATELRDVPCNTKTCPIYQKKQCKGIMNLQFYVRGTDMLGVYQLDTSSVNSIVNINSSLSMLRSISGRQSMIPVTLVVEPREVQPEGKKKTVWVLQLHINMAEAQDAAQRRLGAPVVHALPPPETDQAPDDMYTDDGVAEDPSFKPEPRPEPKPRHRRTNAQIEADAALAAKPVEQAVSTIPQGNVGPVPCSQEAASVGKETHRQVNHYMASDETGLIARNVVKDKSWNITDTGELSEYQAQVIIAVCEGRDEKDVTYNA